jgi:tetratricopeptide (TPR) repeat protein
MRMTRLEQLRKFLEDDPGDPFNIYALALEYQKTDHSVALRLFKQLILEHPDYLATYYHLAKLYQELDEKENATKIYKAGIKKATEINDRKALQELQSAFQELLFE